MPRSLIRVVAFLLVPCLLVDPSLSAALAQQQSGVKLNSFCDQNYFQQEAIVPAVLRVHTALSKLTFRQIRITAALLLATFRRVTTLRPAFNNRANAIGGAVVAAFAGAI